MDYRLTAGQSAWASPYSHLHVPKRGGRSHGPYIRCPSLCSKSSIPGGKDLCSKHITEKRMEVRLVMALVSQEQLFRVVCTNICTLGERYVVPSSLDYLQEALELGKEAKLQVYLGASQDKSRLTGAGAWIWPGSSEHLMHAPAPGPCPFPAQQPAAPARRHLHHGV